MIVRSLDDGNDGLLGFARPGIETAQGVERVEGTAQWEAFQRCASQLEMTAGAAEPIASVLTHVRSLPGSTFD